MIRRSVSLLSVALLVCGATAALADDSEDAAIREAVDHAYVHGVHIDGDTAKMRDGFHESFIMFVMSDEGVSHVTRDAWIERMEAAKAKGDQGPRPEVKADITVIGRKGNAAVVKVDLFRDGKQAFTDFISLYKFDDGWKLVAKTYYRH